METNFKRLLFVMALVPLCFFGKNAFKVVSENAICVEEFPAAGLELSDVCASSFAEGMNYDLDCVLETEDVEQAQDNNQVSVQVTVKMPGNSGENEKAKTDAELKQTVNELVEAQVKEKLEEKELENALAQVEAKEQAEADAQARAEAKAKANVEAQNKTDEEIEIEEQMRLQALEQKGKTEEE